jgi:type IV secretory pathway TraG/TraD family ATPase VirD4
MNRKKILYSGWEILSHETKMLLKAGAEVVIAFTAGHILLTFLPFVLLWPHKAYLFGRVVNANLAALIGFREHGVDVPWDYWLRLAFCFVAASPVWLLLPKLRAKIEQRGTKETTEKHLRGMRLVETSALKEELRQEPGLLPFGELLLPRRYESEHIFIGGKPRVGKSVCLKQQLEAVRQAGARAVVYDFKGEYVELFYRPATDYILNPLDKRGTVWTIFDEIQTVADLNAICDSLIPESRGDDRFWSSAAKDVFRGLLAYCVLLKGKTTNRDLWHTVTRPITELAEMCKATPAGAAGYTYIQDASSKQAASVIAVMMSYISWLEYADDSLPGPRISTASFLAQPGATIFLTGRPEVESALKPYTGLFVDLLGRRMLSLPDGEHDQERKTFFFLDEFGNMQKLPTIKRLLTAGGSKGATVLIGIQDFAAIQRIYGREDAETIFNTCGTVLILNVADPSTAKYFSDRFGMREVERPQENFRMSAQDHSDGLTLSRHEKKIELVLPSEIQSLPKLEGYLKVPEHEPTRLRLSIQPINNAPAVHAAFEMRDGLELVRKSVADTEGAPLHGRPSPGGRSTVAPSTVTLSTVTPTHSPPSHGLPLHNQRSIHPDVLDDVTPPNTAVIEEEILSF